MFTHCCARHSFHEAGPEHNQKADKNSRLAAGLPQIQPAKGAINMPTFNQLRDQNPLLRWRTDPPAAVQPQHPSSVPSSHPAVDPNVPLPNVSSAPRCTQVPAIYLTVERPPISTYDDNPIIDERGAAAFLGLRPETLKKWRQRDQGPDYIQFGQAGPVRYELDTLTAFRAAHRVQVGSNR
jgi:hypothetical protein